MIEIFERANVTIVQGSEGDARHDIVVVDEAEGLIVEIFVKAAGKFIGSGLGANPEFARVLIDCGVQWMQAGNDFEYMIRGCETTFAKIRS